MSSSLVQSKFFDPTGGVTSRSITPDGPVTAGNTLLLCVTSNQSGRTWTVADTVNGSWGSALYLGNGRGFCSLAVFEFLATAGGTPTVTATMTGGSAGLALTFIELNQTTGIIDITDAAFATGATSYSLGPTAAPAMPGEFSLSFAALNGVQASWTASGGYALLNAANTHQASAYKIIPDQSTQTTGFSWPSSSDWSGVILSLGVAAPSGGPQAMPLGEMGPGMGAVGGRMGRMGQPINLGAFTTFPFSGSVGNATPPPPPPIQPITCNGTHDWVLSPVLHQ